MASRLKQMKKVGELCVAVFQSCCKPTIMDNGVLGDCKDTAKNLVSPHNHPTCKPADVAHTMWT